MDVTTAAARRAELFLLDVREDFEHEAGHIDGAVHIPMSELGARLTEVPEDTEVLAICRSGARSAQVTAALASRGYQVHNLEGGMQAWEANGNDVVTDDGGLGMVV